MREQRQPREHGHVATNVRRNMPDRPWQTEVIRSVNERPPASHTPIAENNRVLTGESKLHRMCGRTALPVCRHSRARLWSPLGDQRILRRSTLGHDAGPVGQRSHRSPRPSPSASFCWGLGALGQLSSIPAKPSGDPSPSLSRALTRRIREKCDKSVQNILPAAGLVTSRSVIMRSPESSKKFKLLNKSGSDSSFRITVSRTGRSGGNVQGRGKQLRSRRALATPFPNDTSISGAPGSGRVNEKVLTPSKAPAGISIVMATSPAAFATPSSSPSGGEQDASEHCDPRPLKSPNSSNKPNPRLHVMSPVARKHVPSPKQQAPRVK